MGRVGCLWISPRVCLDDWHGLPTCSLCHARNCIDTTLLHGKKVYLFSSTFKQAVRSLHADQLSGVEWVEAPHKTATHSTSTKLFPNPLPRPFEVPVDGVEWTKMGRTDKRGIQSYQSYR